MKLYRTMLGPVVFQGPEAYILKDQSWDELVIRDDLGLYLREIIPTMEPRVGLTLENAPLLAPIGDRQEVWAAGVTYFRSRDARMEESQEAGGGSFYDRVYRADRPELFFKASPHRV